MEVTVEFDFNGVRVEVEGYRPRHEDEGADITSAHVINAAGERVDVSSWVDWWQDFFDECQERLS